MNRFWFVGFMIVIGISGCSDTARLMTCEPDNTLKVEFDGESIANIQYRFAGQWKSICRSPESPDLKSLNLGLDEQAFACAGGHTSKGLKIIEVFDMVTMEMFLISSGEPYEVRKCRWL